MAVLKQGNTPAAKQANVDVAAKKSAERAKSLNPGEQYAITQVSSNIFAGAFWGFTDLDGIKKHLESIRAASPNIIARKIGNACLIEVNPTYICNALVAVDPNMLSEKDIRSMQQKRVEAELAFETFLIARGKETRKTGRPYEGQVGIYCVNESERIAVKGVNYPAFRIPISTALNLMGRYAYEIFVGGKYISAGEANSLQGNTLFESLVLSPTNTGVFMKIRSTGTAAQYEQADKALKQRLGKQ